MVQKSIADIVADVKICIDEIGLNESEFLISNDNIDMDTIIESKISDALRFANLNADLSLLEPIFEKKTDKTKSEGMGKVSIPLEDSFLRLCYAKMPDWGIPVTEAILYTEAEYATLYNPITTGYPDNPKAAIVEGVSVKNEVVTNVKTLELYSSDSADATIGYISEAEMEGGKYNIAEKIYRGLVYYISGLTLLTYKDAHADSLFNQALIMIGAK